MKGFALDEHGDVLIENNEISIVVGDSLLRQKVWTVLQTNLKEWFFDWDQGIDFSNLLGKGKTEDIRSIHFHFPPSLLFSSPQAPAS